jgi:hypothetical protein
MINTKNLTYFPSGSTIESFLHSENYEFSDCLFFKLNLENKK